MNSTHGRSPSMKSVVFLIQFEMEIREINLKESLISEEFSEDGPVTSLAEWSRRKRSHSNTNSVVQYPPPPPDIPPPQVPHIKWEREETGIRNGSVRALTRSFENLMVSASSTTRSYRVAEPFSSSTGSRTVPPSVHVHEIARSLEHETVHQQSRADSSVQHTGTNGSMQHGNVFMQQHTGTNGSGQHANGFVQQNNSIDVSELQGNGFVQQHNGHVQQTQPVIDQLTSTPTNAYQGVMPQMDVSKHFERAVQTAATAAARAAIMASRESINHKPVSNTMMYSPVKLPPLQLPMFSGTVVEWPEFWALFDTIHTNTQLSQVSKFAYLKDCLTAEAAQCMGGLPITAGAYEIAIDVLCERYGGPEIVISSLYTELRRMPMAERGFDSIENTFDNMERIMRQLSTLGENVSQQRLLVQQIMAKFPLEVIVKLEEIRIETGHQWTVDSLRHSLREFMLVRSNAKEFAELEKPTTSLPVWSTKPTETNGKLPRGCIFCNGNHYDAKCTTIVSSSDRKTHLAINRKCFLCLRTGHMASLCPVKHRYKCQTCNRVGHHNKVICPNADNNSSARQLPGATESTFAGQTTTTLLTSAAAIELPSATVQLQPSVEARILMDTGSHRSYITKGLADKLALPTVSVDMLQVSTFGSTAVRQLTSPLVTLTLPLTDNRSMDIALNVLDGSITNPIPRQPLGQEDLTVINALSDELADHFPTSNANRVASVDILLGSDYFWSIVQGRQQQLPSGLFLISSSLGILISGRHHSERPSQDVPAMPCQTDQLDDNVATMWKLDTIGITDNPTFSDDDMALQAFNNTVKFDINNARYSVTLPWKAPDEVLPSNYGLAMGRLKSLSRRFDSSNSNN